eukprot:scaffold439_cov57-Attheya_sp.AAC.2
MTVSSLWSVLDAAGCGTPIGEADLSNVGSRNDKETNQRDRRGIEQNSPPKSLAVDLSIWICEALTTTALSTFHANPALHLVYHRTLVLLKLGLKLVFVVEGKRRVRASNEKTNKKHESAGNSATFASRRSGTSFWKACQSCEKLLKLLGIPVVRAQAEGEALCALLNKEGFVDGVISNDGDCLLFGAKVIYTRFSVENLERGEVMRYEASNLRAVVEKEEEAGKSSERFSSISTKRRDSELFRLSCQDLIAFALLTGSDLVGCGIPHIGYRKAVRFIKICHENDPLNVSNAALDELQSWRRSSFLFDPNQRSNEQSYSSARCCSVCMHPGDKRCHEKDGCETCGTLPGEPCIFVSEDEKFRRSVKSKALSMSQIFVPHDAVREYFRPNKETIPAPLCGMDKKDWRMNYPKVEELLNSSLRITGRSLENSRDYLKQSISKLLGRIHLFIDTNCIESYGADSTSKDQMIIPSKIIKRVVAKARPCYEVLWSLRGVFDKADEHITKGYECVSLEPQTMIEAAYPLLVEKFKQNEWRDVQASAEDSRRRMFLGISTHNSDPIGAGRETAGLTNNSRPRHRGKKRSRFFESKESQDECFYPPRKEIQRNRGDDADILMRVVSQSKPKSAIPEIGFDSFNYGAYFREEENEQILTNQSERIKTLAPPCAMLNSNHVKYGEFRVDREHAPKAFVHSAFEEKDTFENRIQVAITPILSRRGRRGHMYS